MENNTINTISASLTVEEMVETIKSDFLDRDSETFVKIRTDNRIGWEALIPRGEDLSDVVTGLSGQESKTDFIKGCYSAARDCIIAMDTPYKVSLELTNDTNATDARKVYLETALFDDDQLSMSQKAATFLGLAVHEGSHLKYSDFNLGKKIDNDTVAHLDNIFEDERIERICGQEIPGFANFLKSAKYYKFYLYHKKMAATHVPKNLNDGVRLLNCILAMVRFPSMMNEDDLRQFAPYLYKVRELVTAYPGGYPSTPQENLQLAKDVYEVLKDFFKNNPSQPNQGNGTPKRQDGGQEGGQDAGEPLTDKEAETLVKVLTDAMGEAMQTLSATPQEDGGGLSEEQISKDVSRNDGLVAGICKNTVTLGLNPQAVIYKAENDREVYADSLSRVRRYVPAISKILRGHCEERTLIHRAQRSGQLDTWKIAEARQDVQSVYKRKGRITSDHISVAVLVDESGSMYGEKIRAARDLAVLLNEAITDIPAIELAIYGHTYADHLRDSYYDGEPICELQVYREKNYHPKYALGSVEARSGNLDSVAIKETAARMARDSKAAKQLMFVITDGAPNEECSTLTETVRQLEKQGYAIVAICIEPEYDPSEFYRNYIRYTDMSTLAGGLGKIIKNAIVKNTKVHVI